MDIPELQQKLRESHENFVAYLVALDETAFNFSFEQKWNAGQQLGHIIKSVTPVALAVKLPAVFLKIFFGTANRPSRSYAALVDRYQQKLVQGGRAPSRFIPATITFEDRFEYTKKLMNLVRSLEKSLTRFSEEQLNNLLLPHPLLGKLTLREMIYFTIYHVQHHEKLTRHYLQQRTR